MPLCMTLMPRARAITSSAPMRPKIAPEAPSESAAGLERS